MRILSLIPALLVGILLLPSATAQVTATQSVTITVSEVTAISVSGPVELAINAVNAGSAPTSVTNSSSSYSFTTNGNGKKIAASLDSAFPAGLSLSAQLAPLGSATASGSLELSTSDQDLVTNLGQVSGTAAITYVAAATVDFAPANEERTVTFTVTD